MSKILIVEDESSICGFIVTALENAGYTAKTAGSAADGLAALEAEAFDAMLLDLGLPDMDGIALLEQVRARWGLPVIVVSARTQESDKVQALDHGADDYITKPFGTPELLARIRAALRRLPESEKTVDQYRVGDFCIDFDKHLVLLDGQEIHFTVNEYRLVELLCRNPGKVLTYESISRTLWGPDAKSGNQLLRVNMANIRRKLEKNPAEPFYIATEVGVGYRMREE